jgi:hypothetical protein
MPTKAYKLAGCYAPISNYLSKKVINILSPESSVTTWTDTVRLQNSTITPLSYRIGVDAE